MSLFSRKKRPKKDDLLINEINKTKIALEAAYSNFENVVDPDLIDSCIYEMNAVQNRYKFLLKQAKEQLRVWDKIKDKYKNAWTTGVFIFILCVLTISFFGQMFSSIIWS